MIGEVRLLLDRRGVCRRLDVSISVLRQGGFQWHIEPGSTDRRIVVFPRLDGVRTAFAYV